MEENTEVTNEEINEAVVHEETQDEPAQEERELTPEEKLAELEAARMGTFKVTLSLDDAKYLKNMLDKVEYKGPQQAYLLIISKLEMTNVCNVISDKSSNSKGASRHTVDISSATIESLTFFMNQKTGKGIDSAQKLFSASMQLRPAISEINNLEETLQNLREDLKNTSEE